MCNLFDFIHSPDSLLQVWGKCPWTGLLDAAGMSIYFAYKMIAAINICVTNHRTLNGLHKLFLGN